jgi:tRNA 2-thiouridine synthesizing protein A
VTGSASVLDARGLRCPVPVRLARERLKSLPDGTVLELLGDDPLLVLDAQAFCAQEGHAWLGHREEPGGGWRLSLRKGPARTRASRG